MTRSSAADPRLERRHRGHDRPVPRRRYRGRSDRLPIPVPVPISRQTERGRPRSSRLRDKSRGVQVLGIRDPSQTRGLLRFDIQLDRDPGSGRRVLGLDLRPSVFPRIPRSPGVLILFLRGRGPFRISQHRTGASFPIPGRQETPSLTPIPARIPCTPVSTLSVSVSLSMHLEPLPTPLRPRIIALPIEIRMARDKVRLTLILLPHTSSHRRSSHRCRRGRLRGRPERVIVDGGRRGTEPPSAYTCHPCVPRRQEPRSIRGTELAHVQFQGRGTSSFGS